MIIRRNADLSRFTSFGIGGAADALLIPRTRDDIARAVCAYGAAGGRLIVIGGGSNVLIRDGRLRAGVLRIAAPFNRVTVRGERVEAEAGAALSAVARSAADNGLSGLEWAAGIPGTAGGAAAGNAGAFGGDFAGVAAAVTALTDGRFERFSAADCAFGYRRSVFQTNRAVITNVTFGLKKGERTAINALMRDYAARRAASQPVGRSAGCVFLAAGGAPAGLLIDRAGLKGERIGGAFVSPVHADFIINDGTATFADILALLELVRRRVAKKEGITLETEIKIIE